jgi:hypothetical protein
MRRIAAPVGDVDIHEARAAHRLSGGDVDGSEWKGGSGSLSG